MAAIGHWKNFPEWFFFTKLRDGKQETLLFQHSFAEVFTGGKKRRKNFIEWIFKTLEKIFLFIDFAVREIPC